MSLFATASAQEETDSLTRQHWFEARTAHFNLYSCGTPQEVYKVVARLEQFRDAYGLLAGAQSLSSPPITVIAFPNHKAMEPFLPQYQGQAMSLSGFFKRSSDENLIVLALTGTNSESLDTIYHEFTHLLLRRNDGIWPVWLQEGMAEMYSTFESTGRGVRFGKPIEWHLETLQHEELMPLKDLLSVTHDSPQYNERNYQGMFYAESWALTHFLMNGDDAALKARFRDYTPLLRLGQTPAQAFTNATATSPLPAIEADFRRYLTRGQFDSLSCRRFRGFVRAPPGCHPPHRSRGDLFPPRRRVAPHQSLRRRRILFHRSRKTRAQQPAFALRRVLGLLSAEREKPDGSHAPIAGSSARGSTSFLAHYVYAQEKFHLQGDSARAATPASIQPLATWRFAANSKSPLN